MYSGSNLLPVRISWEGMAVSWEETPVPWEETPVPSQETRTGYDTKHKSEGPEEDNWLRNM